MIGTLSEVDIESVLKSASVGRLAMHASGRTYVVPISYVYDGGTVYFHSADGMKLRMMRENPEVCFEVDLIENVGNWRSVVAWGRYEELTSDLALAGRNLLVARLSALGATDTVGPSGRVPGDEGIGVVYRIRLTERTGRFEKR